MADGRVDRRAFLKNTAGAVVGGSALGGQASAQPLAPPSAQQPDPESLTTERCGADCMVDVIKAIGLEYICANPGSSFRALHESLVNYGGNTKPELITCCHE